MSHRLNSLRRTAHLIERTKHFVLFGIPAVVALLWLSLLSENFVLGIRALQSGLFVYVVVFVPVAITYAFVSGIVSVRLKDAERQSKLPVARVIADS